MGVTRFFYQKRELCSKLADQKNSKRPYQKSSKTYTTPTSPWKVFEESLESSDS